MITPMVRRNVCEPLVNWAKGSNKLRLWRELEKTQYLPESVLLERQWKGVESLIRFLWERNGFYRARLEESGVSPEMVRSPEDLALIPILTKEEIRRSTPLMISWGYERSKLLHFKTGGSTGKALDIYLTEECSELRNACARRHDRWTGWEVGEPIAAVWGNPHIPCTVRDKLINWLLAPFIYLDTMQVNERSVKAFASEWERVGPSLLFGHAHSIFILAQYIRDLGIRNIRPRGIISSSMMLMPHERGLIEEVFGIKVTDRYGCEEVSLIGCECEKHDGMHLNVEHLFIEFVREDGTSCRPGEPGRIVVTDLVNRAMPLIRYNVGDVGCPTERRCTCGRGLPLMEGVTGRVADFLVKRDGTRVAGVSLIENTLTQFPGLDQMQIIQNGYEEVVLRIVAGTAFKEEVILGLKRVFSRIFGDAIEVRIELVEEIAPEKSGKYRFSLCNIGAPWQG